MKFCYIDESGTGDNPYAVMVGIIVDAQRMHVTKNEWQELLNFLSNHVGKPINEIHTTHLYAGNNRWRTLSDAERTYIISFVFDWLEQRKHHIVYSVVDREKFDMNFNKEPFSSEIKDVWHFMALHLALSIQKYGQTSEKNKGHTLLIFDNGYRGEELFKLIMTPLAFTETYYSKLPNRPPLDQIIDVPYFGHSHHVGLIQVADIVSFFIRRFVEMKENRISANYEGEEEKVEKWVRKALNRSIAKNNMYLSRNRCDCADLFYHYAPSSFLEFLRTVK